MTRSSVAATDIGALFASNRTDLLVLAKRVMELCVLDNGQFKEDALPAQLYDLEYDPNQTQNLYHKPSFSPCPRCS